MMSNNVKTDYESIQGLVVPGTAQSSSKTSFPNFDWNWSLLYLSQIKVNLLNQLILFPPTLALEDHRAVDRRSDGGEKTRGEIVHLQHRLQGIQDQEMAGHQVSPCSQDLGLLGVH